MNKKLLFELARRYDNGLNDGITASNGLFLLALYNVCDEYVPEDKQAPLARAIEAEMNRIFTEEFNSDIALMASYHIEDVRQKWEMST